MEGKSPGFEQSDFCFVPDAETVYKLVRIIQRHGDGFMTVSDLDNSSRQSRVKEELATPVGSVQELDHPPQDLIKLQYVNRPAILHTLRSRFMNDQIYTSIGQILVALNPFKWIKGIYDTDVKEKYKNRLYNLSDNPHIFAIAHDAFADLNTGQNQSMIISGESGAGKTEATKQCLSYLAFIAGSSSGIQEKILKASPILEAWGNAKTLRNNNSSRFGKYIEIWFDSTNSIVGSSNTTYILEKSRVVRQEENERNYHVFYQLLQGSSPEQLHRLRLVPTPSHKPDLAAFNYINQSGCINIDDVDDAADFLEANQAFESIGFSQQEQDSLYQTIAGILHLGNIIFFPNPDDAEISAETESDFLNSASMFQVDPEEFRRALLTRKITSGSKRRSVVLSPYNPAAAADSRDALAKEVYRRCFDWIVYKINQLMYNQSVSASLMIGVLDIFGFEIFKKNSFEQLCINLANEALQQHFNYNIFQAEMNVYLSEDVPVPKLDFKDNQDVLDLIMKRPKGLIPMLDEEGIIPKGSADGFLSKFAKQHSSHPRFKLKQKTNELGIVHYAGEVYYDVSLFLVKNKDTLSQDLIDCLSQSSHSFLSDLFTEAKIILRESQAPSYRSDTMMSGSEKSPGDRGKRGTTIDTKQTVGRKFSTQLESLVTNLNSTKPRYVRCIKPNQVKKPNIFVHDLTNEQLTYSGVFEAVIIMQNGYPFRLSLPEFRGFYHMLIPNIFYRKIIFQSTLYEAFAKQFGITYDNISSRIVTIPLVDIESFILQFEQNQSNVLGGKRKKLNTSICTREQSLLMVRVISSALPQIDYHKCFVGKTKVFYRAQEHRLLLESRIDVMQQCLQVVQRQARRYIASKLVNTILSEEKKAMEAIHARNLPALNQASQIMVDNAARLQRSNRLTCSIKIVDICKGYTHALNQETSLQEELTRIWNISYAKDPSKASQEEELKYQQLAPLMAQVVTISFEAVHKGERLHLDWRENPVLVQFEERVEALGLLVQMKKNFAVGIQEKNEFLLETAKEQYSAFKANYASLTHVLPPSKNLESVEQQANVIIENAKKEYDELMQHALKMIPQGRFQSKRRASSAFEIDFTVDPLPLNSLLQQFEEKYDFDMIEESTTSVASTAGKKKRPPVKVQLLIRTSRQLVQLRQLAKGSQWKECFESIQIHWKQAIEKATEAAASAAPFQSPTTSLRRKPSIDSADSSPLSAGGKRRKSFLNMNDERMTNLLTGKELYLPKELSGAILDELQQLIIASIYYIVIPRFQQLLTLNTIPEIPYYYQPCEINNDELDAQLQEVAIYEQYFDPPLFEFLAIVGEHVAVRQAVSSGNKDVILQALNGITKIPTSHLDYQHLLAYETMYEKADELIDALILERWRGEKGCLLGPQVHTQRLEHAMKEAQKLKVVGDLWKQVLFLGQNLLTIRIALQQEEFDEAEREIDILRHSTAWKSLSDRASQISAPEIQRLCDNLHLELESYTVEINHAKAFNFIALAFEEGAVPASIEDPIPPEGLSESHYEEIIHEYHALLVENIGTKLFLQQSRLIVFLRHLLITEQWAKVGEELTPLLESTNGFTHQCHPLCQEEFGLIHARYLDYQCRMRLIAAFANSEVPSLPDNACELHSIVKEFQSYKNLSISTKDMILVAKALVALRCAIRDGYWEPESIFSLGRVAIEDLPAAIAGASPSEKDSTSVSSAAPAATLSSKEMRSIDRTVHVFRTLETVIPVKDVEKKIDQLEIKNLSVTEAFFWLQSGGKEIPDSCGEEMNSVYRLSTDRKCRILLLMAASTGKVLGTIEKLNHRSIKFDGLKGALAYCDANKTSWTETTTNWVTTATKLLEIREVVYENCLERINNPSNPDNIHQILPNTELQELLERTIPGFPLHELKLVLNKVNDLTVFEELIQSLTFGQPTFANNKFDASRVQASHLLERLDSAKRLAVRSDRLDRLFFYLELIINLRTAVAANQWDFTERGESRTSNLDRNVITVKKCLNEYSQAQKFFRTPVPDVPPPLIIDEFSLVSREWERRLTLQRFTNAFKIGPVTGLPYSLQFSLIRVDQLKTEIARVQLMEKESGEVDKDVQVFVHAAHELIAVRQEALQLQQSYRAPAPNFAKATNALSHILTEASFLPDAINRAVNRISTIATSSSRDLQGDYEPIDKLLKQMQYCPKLPFRVPELDLLRTDIAERMHATEVLSYLQSMKELLFARVTGNGKESSKESSLGSSAGKEVTVTTLNTQINQLVKSLHSYQQRKAQIIKEFADKRLSKLLTTSSSGAGGTGPSSKVLEFLEYSAVLLVHIYRAKIHQYYDSYERAWKEDMNFLRTPRLLALIQHLSHGKYTFQQIIRSARKIAPFHLAIHHYLTLVEQEIEDSVSEIELTQALTDEFNVVTGNIGEIKVPPQAVDYAVDVVERVNNVGILNAAAIKPFKQMTEMMIKLRGLARKLSYSEIRNTVCKFLKVSEKDLAALCTILYEPTNLSSRLPCSLAQEEFTLIAKTAVDYLWNEKMKVLLIRDAIQGARGSIFTFQIETAEGKQHLKIADIMRTDRSDQMVFLSKLGKLVYQLRSMIASIGRENESNAISIRSETPVNAAGNHNPAQGILWGLNVGLMINETVSHTVSKVTQIGKVNWNWSILRETMQHEMTHLCQQILQLIDEEQALSNYFSHEKALRNVLTQESQMLLSHLSFIHSGHSLEVLLDRNYFKFSPQGLEIYYGKAMEENFVSIIKESEKQEYQASLANEFYCASLLKVVKALRKLCDQLAGYARNAASSGSNNSSTISASPARAPLLKSNSVSASQGMLSISLDSEEFSLMIPAICEYLQLIADFDQKGQANGYKKRLFYTQNMTDSLVALRACIHEQSHLASLLKIIVAEEVYLFEDETTGGVSFHLRQLHEVNLIGKRVFSSSSTDESTTKEENSSYVTFSQELVNYVDSLNTITSLGKTLQEFTRQLIKFRIEIYQRHWFKAQLVYDRLASFPEYLHIYSKDLGAFQVYQQILHSQRQLEYLLYQASFPNIDFWTLHTGANQILDNMSQGLDKVMRSYVDGSSPSLPKYKIFEELTEVAYMLLDLMESWKSGIIISFNDFIDYSSHKLILNVTHQIGDEVVLHFQTKESLLKQEHLSASQLGTTGGKHGGGAASSVGSAEGGSVLAAMISLESLLDRCQCLSPYFKTHLQKELIKLELEVAAIQLEQVVKHAFDHVQFVGLAGELHIADCSEPILALCQTLEKNSTILSSCLSLRQAWYSAKSVLGFISAHSEGNLKRMLQWMDILRYLSSQSTGILELVKSSNTNEYAIDIKNILIMDEYEYSAIYSKPLSAYHSHLTPLETIAAESSETPYFAKIQDEMALSRNMKECLGVSLGGASESTRSGETNAEVKQLLQLRPELRPYLPLLHQHSIFEQLYTVFLTALHDRPASGFAGELDGFNVKYSVLEDILTRIKENEFELRGYCLLLSDAAESLFSIRKGQKLADENLIQEGISLAKDALSREQAYEGQTDVIYFGKEQKQFLQLAAKEIEIAEDDLKQRYLIRMLKEGLASPGIPSHDYPFNIRAVEVESLVDACNIATKIPPSCRQAQDLLSSAKVIVKVRKLIIQRNWKGTLEAIGGLYHEETNSFDLARNKDELFSAWKVASVSEAVDLAYACYSQGKLAPVKNANPSTDENIAASRDTDDVGPMSPVVKVNLSAVNADTAKLAIDAFASIRDEWMNEKLLSHQVTCAILHQIRSYFLDGDYLSLQTYCSKVLEQVQRDEVSIIPKAMDEISFAKDHSAYLIVTSTLRRALNNNMIIGQIGYLDSQQLDVAELKRALKLSIEIVSKDREVERLQKTAKFIYSLRLAQMKNLWINFPLEEQLQGFIGEIITDTKVEDLDLHDEDGECDLDEDEDEDEEEEEEADEEVEEEEGRDEKVDGEELEQGDSEESISEVEVKDEDKAGNEAKDRTDSVEQATEESKKEIIVSEEAIPQETKDSSSISAEKTRARSSSTFVRASLLMKVPPKRTLSAQELKELRLEQRREQKQKYEELIASIQQHADTRTVEDILFQFDQQLQENLIDPTAFPEIELAYNEMRFRQIIVRVISAIYTTGFTGIPGDIAETDVLTDVLENCLSFAAEHNDIAQSKVCAGFVRDAKLLLDARRCRLDGDYVQLQEIIQVAEEHNTKIFEYRNRQPMRSFSTSTNDATDSLNGDGINQGEDLEDVKPILSRVWEELMLLKYDSLFQIALHEFANEMKREERLSLDRRHRRDSMTYQQSFGRSATFEEDSEDEENEGEEIDHNVRIYRIEAILEFTRNAALGYPSTELERLLEAIKLALKLRKFVRDEPSKSPQHIIDEIAQVKSRDRRKGVTCYVSLLIYEISKMSNVLDFPVLLETITNEIIHGRQYLEKPIGFIDKNDISLEVFSAAYEEANASLEIMGTDENRSFMKLAYGIMEMRKCIQVGDFSSAMTVVMQNEQYLQSPLVVDEIKRLRVEMENQDAGKLISYGLKTGRCLDVIAIAKMRSGYEMQNSFDPEVQYQVEMIFRNKGIGIENVTTAAILAGETGSTALRGNRSTIRMTPGNAMVRNKRSQRRVSQGIADMMLLFQKMYLHGEGGGGEGGTGSVGGVAGEELDDNLPEVDKNTWQPAPQFVESVKNSIYSLKRAVNVASRVSVKAQTTDYYLQAAKIILHLRESIVYNQWNVVEEIVEQELDLPEVALEEVNAVREGLLYQKCLFTVCESLVVGTICGEVYNINFHLVEFMHLVEVLEAFEIGGFQDRANVILMELVKRVINVRRSFLRWAYSEGIISQELIHSNDNIRQALIRAGGSSGLEAETMTIQPSSTAKEIARRTSMMRNGSSAVISTLLSNINWANKDLELFRVLDEYEAFREQQLQEMKRSLGLITGSALSLGGVMSGNRSRTSSNATASGKAEGGNSQKKGEELLKSDFDWINRIPEATSVIEEEVSLIKEVIEYRNLIHHMIAVLKVFPIPLLHYLQYQENSKAGNQVSNKLLLTTFASNHSLRRREYISSNSSSSLFGSALTSTQAARDHYYIYQKNQLEANLRILSAEYPIGSTDFALYREILSENDIYFVRLLDTAIIELENYVDKVRHSTSEELIIILSVAKTILRMRQLLQSSHAEESEERPFVEKAENKGEKGVPLQFMQEISQWIADTTKLIENNVIPHNFGLKEIHLYLVVNRQLLAFHQEILVELGQLLPHVTLDCLDMTRDLSIHNLQLLLNRIEQFLAMHSKLIHSSFLQFLEKIYIIIQIIQNFQEENDLELHRMFQSYHLSEVLALKFDGKLPITLLGGKISPLSSSRHLSTETIGLDHVEGLGSSKSVSKDLLFAPECPELQELFDYLLLGYYFYSFHRSLQERVQHFNRHGEYNSLEFPVLSHQKFLLQQDYQLFHQLFEQFRMIQLFPLSFDVFYRDEEKETTTVASSKTLSERNSELGKDGERRIEGTNSEKKDEALLLEVTERRSSVFPRHPSNSNSPLISDMIQTRRSLFLEDPQANKAGDEDQTTSDKQSKPKDDEEDQSPIAASPFVRTEPSTSPNVSIHYYNTKTFLIGKTLYKLLYNLCESNRWFPVSPEEAVEEEEVNAATEKEGSDPYYVSSEEDEDERFHMSEDSSAADISIAPLLLSKCTHPLFLHYFDMDSSIPPPFIKVSAVSHRKVHTWIVSRQLHHFLHREIHPNFHFLHHKESIFHLVYSSFVLSYYPDHLSPLLHRIICELINQHFRHDLTYYYQKGLPSIDRQMGNLILSELYLRFANNSVKEIREILSFCQRHQIVFSLSRGNQSWFEWIEKLIEIRNYLIREPNIFNIKEYLEQHPLLSHYLKKEVAQSTSPSKKEKSVTLSFGGRDEKPGLSLVPPNVSPMPSPDEKKPPADKTSVKARLLAFEEDNNGPSLKKLLAEYNAELQQRKEQEKEQQQVKKKGKIHPSLYLFTLLPSDPQYYSIMNEIEAYYIYLVAIEDEILVMDCVKKLYEVYQSHSAILSQLPTSGGPQQLLFTKDLLSESPFDRLLPMIQQFALRTETSKFHEFIVYLGVLLYNLIYNLFLGSLNIVQGILNEFQTILYEDHPSYQERRGSNHSGSSTYSSLPGGGAGLKTVHDILFRIDCPLVEYLKQYFSSIRKLIMFMSQQIWPKFSEDHIIYQKYVPKTATLGMNAGASFAASHATLGIAVANYYSSPTKSAPSTGSAPLQSPMPTITSFFASPESQSPDQTRIGKKGNNFSNNVSPTKPPLPSSQKTSDDLSIMSSPFKALMRPAPTPAQSLPQIITSPYLQAKELTHRQSFLTKKPSVLNLSGATPRTTAIIGGQSVVMIPIYQSLIRSNYEFTLLIIHRICEIKDFMNEQGIISPQMTTGAPGATSELFSSVAKLRYEVTQRQKDSLLAFDRNLMTLIPKKLNEQLPYELYHRLLSLYLDLLDSPFLIMNPQYMITLVLILYYLRKEIVRTKQRDFDQQKELQQQQRAEELLSNGRRTRREETLEARLLKRIEKFNHRFSLYTSESLLSTAGSKSKPATKGKLQRKTTKKKKKSHGRILSSFDEDDDYSDADDSDNDAANDRNRNLMGQSFDWRDEEEDSDADEVDENRGFESEEEEDYEISQALFGRRLSQSQGTTAALSSAAHINVDQKKPFSAEAGDQPFSERKEGQEETQPPEVDAYQAYMKSCSSETLRKECFMINLSYDLFLFLQELPPFIQEYYSSEIYQSYRHKSGEDSPEGIGSSHSFDFDPDSNPPVISSSPLSSPGNPSLRKRVSPLSDDDSDDEEEEVFPYDSDEPLKKQHPVRNLDRVKQQKKSPVKGNKPAIPTAHKKPFQVESKPRKTKGTPPLTTTRKSKEAFQQLIYHYYYHTLHQTSSSLALNSGTNSSVGGHPFPERYQGKVMEYLSAVSSRRKDSSLDLNGFYPLHNDLIPNLISLFKHLYLMEADLEKAMTLQEIQPMIQQYRLEFHQRRHSAYYSEPEKHKRRSTLRLSMTNHQHPARLEAQGKGPRGRQQSWLRRSSIESTITSVGDHRHPREDDGDDEPQETQRAKPRKSLLYTPPEMQGSLSEAKKPSKPVKYVEVLKMTEDLEVNNEVWFIFQLQKMVDIVQREQQMVVEHRQSPPSGESSDPEQDHRYHRNHYFYYNGLFQRSLALLKLCQGIFPSLDNVFHRKYPGNKNMSASRRQEQQSSLRREEFNDFAFSVPVQQPQTKTSSSPRAFPTNSSTTNLTSSSTTAPTTTTKSFLTKKGLFDSIN